MVTIKNPNKKLSFTFLCNKYFQIIYIPPYIIKTEINFIIILFKFKVLSSNIYHGNFDDV